MDMYMEEMPRGWRRALAAWLQPRVFQAAYRVLALTDGIASYYKERYGIEAVTLRHCINTVPIATGPISSSNERFVIGYVGNVDQDRIEGLRELVAVLSSRREFELRYISPLSEEWLAQRGLWFENARLFFAADDEALRRTVAECDVLYLPISFGDRRSEERRAQLRTSFPTKCCEYLVSGRPIVAHCPKDSFVAKFFLEHQCGLVVTEPGSAPLLSALEKLRGDPALVRFLVRNAFAAAECFAGQVVAGRLRAVLAGCAGVSSKNPKTQ
jgi:hypothetical protein